ncbi:MAG: coproporphyrinogen dehydrogenase HemZ, partial [Clostridia bacterium]|nr:coproporphyrinogen dehydrogenase HemZ [Clostridia bacterium]
RPVKFARGCIDYKNYLKNEMLVSDKKVNLVDDIIKTQDKLNLDFNKVDLFVGIPFCPSRCAYCSFISEQITKKSRLNEYIDTLCAEIEAGKYYYQNNLGSIYIGGGTPIALPIELLEKLLKTIGKQNVEYTIEAGRPDCFSKDKLKLFADYGVSRICVNPQTLNDKTLVKMGRKHTAESVFSAYKMAREFPFIINTDLIAGLTDETFLDFKYSLDTILTLNPENVTVHTLCLKAGSKLKTEQEVLSDLDVEKMVDYTYTTLKNLGYNPYYCYRQKYSAGNLENVGYSKSGAECRYNICVMEELTDNPAFGAGANTKIIFNQENRIERYFPPKDINTYLNKLDKIIKEKDNLFKKKLQLN